MVRKIIEILLAILWCYATFLSPFSKTDGTVAAAIIYGIMFLLPIVVIEVVTRITKSKPVSTTNPLPTNNNHEMVQRNGSQKTNTKIRPRYTPEQKANKSMWRVFQVFSIIMLVIIGFTYAYSQGVTDKFKSEEEITVRKINTFQDDKYEIMEGEEIVFELTAFPSRLDDSKITICLSDVNILEIKSVDYKDDGNRTSITIICIGKKEGNATIVVSDKDGNNSVSTVVSVIKEPLVNSFLGFDTDNVVMALGNTQTISITAKASELSSDDVYVKASEEATVKTENIVVENIENGEYKISFDVNGNATGRSEIQVIAIDEKTVSEKVRVTVVEEKMLRTVWVNYTGDKYHYNKSCAGNSAKEETLYEASRFKEPCSKCVN